MGFFKRNKYSFEIYLTDKGRETFVNNGLRNEIKFFSLIDNSNYQQLEDFDPTVITEQTIPTVKYVGSVEVNDSDDVYTQNSNRGSVDNNIVFKNGFLGVRQSAENNYIAYDPDLQVDDLKITTFKE